VRRRLLFGGAAVGALAAGIGARQWQVRRATASELAGAGSDDGGFWSMRFPTLDGAPLAMSSFRGRPLLLNFWATWCPPCIKEMPQIDRFYRLQAARGGAGWQVLGLAVDKAEPVRAFLRQAPVAYPIALAGFDGVEVSIRLGNTGSGLPFTLAFDAGGAVVQRKGGETNLAELTRWAQESR
jgi:thiol-disulfide isomerase/thioredoxin